LATVNRLYYGDNLDILREFIPSGSVDLVYLDPPFNSEKNYNVIFKKRSDKDSNEASSQILAFEDTWRWTAEDEDRYETLLDTLDTSATDALVALRRILGPSDMMSYIIMMTPRLVELHRALKPTGTLYLHCDPSASHYLKVLLDAIFGPANFGNEIIWAYQYGGRSKKAFGRKHDVIFRYTKTQKFTFNSDSPAVRIPHLQTSIEQNFRYTDENGRRYREATWPSGKKYRYYADEGRLRDDVWTDINAIHSQEAERLGYPTQKPKALLKIIIEASSNPGDVVLDPFCGCGTAVVAAEDLGRQWVGIDVTYLAIELISRRLRGEFTDRDLAPFEILGVPRDVASARKLFETSPFQFEAWAVTMVDGRPNAKGRQHGDKGIDGRIRFWNAKEIEEMIVSVKGGETINPSMVRDLRGVLDRTKSPLGLMIMLKEPTRGMTDEAATAGVWKSKMGTTFPRIQFLTVEQILAGKRPQMPSTDNSYREAQPSSDSPPELELGL
jgi:DNA modification methylase